MDRTHRLSLALSSRMGIPELRTHGYRDSISIGETIRFSRESPDADKAWGLLVSGFISDHPKLKRSVEILSFQEILTFGRLVDDSESWPKNLLK